jgi:hypothetical protein
MDFSAIFLRTLDSCRPHWLEPQHMAIPSGHAGSRKHFKPWHSKQNWALVKKEEIMALGM